MREKNHEGHDHATKCAMLALYEEWTQDRDTNKGTEAQQTLK